MLNLMKPVQTKFVESDSDEFEVISTFPALRQWHIVMPTAKIISRGQLRLLGVERPQFYCTSRNLRPITDTAPEKFGLLPGEVLEQCLLPEDDTAKLFESLFAFIRHEDDTHRALRELSSATDEAYAKHAEGLFMERVAPAALLPILNAAFPKNPLYGKNLPAANLATKLLLECELNQLTGPDAYGEGINKVIGLLQESDQRGDPRCGGALAVRLLDILRCNKPPRDLELFRSVTRYQRLMDADWGAEREAADHAYFRIFVA